MTEPNKTDGLAFVVTIAIVLLAALYLLSVATCTCHGAELLDFKADWCAPCRKMQPTIDALVARGVNVQQIDVDQRPDLKARYNVQSLPTFIVTQDGREIARHVGATTADHLVALLNTARPAQPAATPAAGRRSFFRMRGDYFSREFLQQAEDRANQCRRDLALEWTGAELPDWTAPADVELVKANGDGGSTSFAHINGRAEQFTGKWQGSETGLLRDVIPHEVLHTVFATHFGRPLPRWCDEGAAIYAESPTSRKFFSARAVEGLKTNQAMPTSRLVSLTEYPGNVFNPNDTPAIDAFYCQSGSLAAFLIEHNGPVGFVAFIESTHSQGMPAALSAHYELSGLDQLQADWLSWVKAGSPAPPVEVAFRGGRPCCYRWRPLRRLWERRPGFIIPRRGQPRRPAPAGGSAAPRLDQTAPPIAAAPGPQPGPVETPPAADPPLVPIAKAEPAADPPPAATPAPPPPVVTFPNEPAAAAPSAPAAAEDEGQAGGLIARIKAQADAAREKLRAHFEDRLAKLRGRHAEDLEARDQAAEDLRHQVDTHRDEADGLRGKLADAHAKLDALKKEIATKGPDAAAGAIASRGIKSLLLAAGLGNIPAALLATAAGVIIRRRFKKLRAKLHASEDHRGRLADIVKRLKGGKVDRPSPPPASPAEPAPLEATAAGQVDQVETMAPAPPVPQIQPARTVKVVFEGLLDEFPNDAAKDYSRNLVANGKNLFHEVFVCALFREAVDKAEKNDPEIKTIGGANVASAIRQWVRNEFARRAGVDI